jgi:hypothetical protein
MVNKQPINIHIFYEMDEQGAGHALLLADSLQNYHMEGQEC